MENKLNYRFLINILILVMLLNQFHRFRFIVHNFGNLKTTSKKCTVINPLFQCYCGSNYDTDK